MLIGLRTTLAHLGPDDLRPVGQAGSDGYPDVHPDPIMSTTGRVRDLYGTERALPPHATDESFRDQAESLGLTERSDDLRHLFALMIMERSTDLQLTALGLALEDNGEYPPVTPDNIVRGEE